MRFHVLFPLLFCVQFQVFSQKAKSALISVYITNDVTTTSSLGLGGAVTATADSVDFKKEVNRLDSLTNQHVLPLLPYDFLGKEQVLAIENYATLDDFGTNTYNEAFVSTFSVADGYIGIDVQEAFGINKQAIQKIFESEPQLETVAVSFITFRYKKAMSLFYVKAFFNLTILDKELKKILDFREDISSKAKHTVNIPLLEIDYTKYQPQFERIARLTIHDLLTQVENEYPKKISKMAKKL